MQKVIRVDNTVILVLDNGTVLQKTNVSEKEFQILLNPETSEEDILGIMNPEYHKFLEEKKVAESILTRVRNSKYLTHEDNVIYWKEVSQLSVPKELVNSILDAEDKNDEIKIETYRNFWTLMSLNPNEQCRLNLFWFLNRNGLVISRSGFFVAYRNADYLKTEPDGTKVYTDRHSHSFHIRIGDMVSMDRSKCDNNQDVTCSRGLMCSPLY